MEKARVERRLAAILAADVAGYSRLMGADEEGTLAQLKAHRSKVWNPAIKRHRGFIANTAGDSILAEFASVVDAVACAVAVQRSMLERNSQVPPDKRMEFASRYQSHIVMTDYEAMIFMTASMLGAPAQLVSQRGGICISRQVLDQVEGKLELSIRELGRQNLKNIAKLGEVYAIHSDDGERPGSGLLATANSTGDHTGKRPTASSSSYANVAAAGPPARVCYCFGHLEYDWELPISQHFLLGLAKDHTLVRYDARGNGLSDWDVNESRSMPG